MMQTILKKLGYEDISSGYKDNVTGWQEIWKGKIEGFHEYREFNGREYVTRNRRSLGMGKKACEDWADALWNPETVITIGDVEAEKAEMLADTTVAKTEQDAANDGEEVSYGKDGILGKKKKADKPLKTQSELRQDELDEILKDNNFENRFNELLEKTFAFGSGATVEHKDQNGKVYINFIDIDNIYPLSVSYGTIENCAFGTQVDSDTKALQIHLLADDGINYVIKNHVFRKEGNGAYEEIELPPELDDEVKSPVKLFQIIKPAIANNLDKDQPLGISIFANAFDELKGVDQAYTSLDAELRTGRIRAFIQAGGLSWGIDEKGNEYPNYDSNQEEYYVLPEDTVNDDGTLIRVDAPTLRVESIEKALEKQLTLFGRKVGFGDDSYSFKEGTVYTNTSQVLSTNSKFYKTRQKHITLLEKAVEDLVVAVMYLRNGKIIEDITVDFDDSIIEDADSNFNNALMLLNAGYISQQEFFKRTENLTDELAAQFVEKMVADQNLTPEVELEGEDEQDYKFGGSKFGKTDKKKKDEKEEKEDEDEE